VSTKPLALRQLVRDLILLTEAASPPILYLTRRVIADNMKDQPHATGQPPRERIEPAHVLVNYFASLPSPRSDSELRGSLHEIARRLSASQVFAGDEQQLDTELDNWASKGLIIRGQLDRKWRVPSHLHRFYIGFSRSVNERLDRDTFGSLLTAIRAGHTKESVTGPADRSAWPPDPR